MFPVSEVVPYLRRGSAKSNHELSLSNLPQLSSRAVADHLIFGLHHTGLWAEPQPRKRPTLLDFQIGLIPFVGLAQPSLGPLTFLPQLGSTTYIPKINDILLSVFP